LSSRKEQREEARKQREEREAEERAKQRRKRRLWQIGATLAVAVAVVVIAIAVSSSGSSGGKKPSPGQTQQTSTLFTGIAQNGVTMGNPQAKVTIYEFADLQCPFCREYTVGANGSNPVFPQLVTKYVKPGKVKMVFRNLTFIGPDSVTAARAAAAAGAQNKLWDFVDLFYKQQGTENTGYVTDKFIQNLATSVGIDPNKLKADQSAPFVEQQLGEAQDQAQQFSINSTPSFLIQIGNGKPQKLNYSNFNLSEFSGPIDAAIAKAGG
jgi:protein-disulfide isomerase